MINIPGEALFDLLQTNKAQFRDDYADYCIEIGDDCLLNDDEEMRVIVIKKSSFMELLLNRSFVCSEFSIRIQI